MPSLSQRARGVALDWISPDWLLVYVGLSTPHLIFSDPVVINLYLTALHGHSMHLTKQALGQQALFKVLLDSSLGFVDVGLRW